MRISTVINNHRSQQLFRIEFVIAWDFISLFIELFEVVVDSFQMLVHTKIRSLFHDNFSTWSPKTGAYESQEHGLWVKSLFPRVGMLLCITGFVLYRICPVSVRNKYSSLDLEQIVILKKSSRMPSSNWSFSRRLGSKNSLLFQC